MSATVSKVSPKRQAPRRGRANAGAEAGSALETQVKELLFLQRLSQAAATTTAPDALLGLIIQETTGALGTDVCSVYLWDPQRQALVLTATNGLSGKAIGRAQMRLGEGITGWVAQQREPLAVADVRVEPRFKWMPGVDQARFVSMLSIPILAGPRVVGVLNVQTERRRIFDQPDIDFLLALAGQVAGILERSELHRRLELQLNEIRLSQDIHTRFTRLALSGAGLPSILAAVETLAGCHVGLYDPDGYRLAVSGARVRGGALPPRIEVPAGLTSAEAGDQVVSERDGRILVPLHAGEGLLAVLMAVPATEVEEAIRRRALEHGATVLALELAKERAAAEVERRLRGDLLEDLVRRRHAPGEAKRLAEQAERLGFRISDTTWLLLLEPDDEAAATALGSRATQDRLNASLSDLTRRRFAGSLVTTRSSGITLLLPGDEKADAAAEFTALQRFGELLLQTVETVSRGTNMSLGIGNRTRSVDDLPRAHEEARQALRLAHRGGRRRQVTSYRGLGAFRLLLEIERPEALNRYVDEMLGPLARYEESRDTPLIATLEELIAAHWNQREAARRLHIHINTLLYRIQRIEQLSGFSLGDAETRVALAVAMRARTLLPEE
jgi:DNA-binding PucR family transcriptional regulator/putative methionine-R-sulfoxide reductase with GAF domain